MDSTLRILYRIDAEAHTETELKRILAQFGIEHTTRIDIDRRLLRNEKLLIIRAKGEGFTMHGVVCPASLERVILKIIRRKGFERHHLAIPEEIYVRDAR